MKKLLYFLMAVAGAGFMACSDQGDVVDDLIEEIKNRPIVKQLEYTLTAADYSTISSTALNDAGDDADKKALANAVKSTNSLNGFVTPADYVPAILGPKYPALGLESAVQVTYAYTPDYLAGLVTAPPPAEVLLFEDFESYANRDPLDKNGWRTVITKGTKNWNAAIYSNNAYAYINVFSGVSEESESYLITPQIDLTETRDNYFSFDVTTGYVNEPCLSVLVSADENAATAPASANWQDITASFEIPMQSTNWPPFIKAGMFNLDTDFAGKKIYIAFRFSGGNAIGKTTGYEIDNVTVSSGKPVIPQPGEVYINDPEQGWIVLANGISLTTDDYAAMGVSSLTAATAPNYLPRFLAQKFPYAQEGDKKAVLYGSNKDEYVYTGGRWMPTLAGAPLTDQFVHDGTKWIFDPTIKYRMVKADYQLVIDHVRNDPDLSIFFDTQYNNAEWYYGFSAYQDNVNLRILGGSSNHNNVYGSQDTELHALDGDLEAQVALLWERLEQEGVPLFLSLKYPLSPAISQGVQLYYNITMLVFAPDGETQTSVWYEMRYKVSEAGAPGKPATFEFISREEIGTTLN